MGIGVFTEKRRPPTDPEISAVVGSALDLWTELSRWLTESFSAHRELKYMYGQKYGWAQRFQIRGVLLTALYPTQGGFTSQVILGRTALEQASRLKLGRNATEAIDRAHLYAEGKWLFIPIESKRDCDDVKSLLRLKVESTKIRARTRVVLSASNG